MPYVGSLPQSGCTFTDPTQFVMIELEFGSTGAEEISVFKRLLLVKGTKPLRLAPCPVDIPLQARLPPPVPFPLPPVPTPPLLVPPPVCFETPEQAVRAITMAIMEKRETIVLTRRIATFCATRRESERGLSDMSHFQGRAAALWFRAQNGLSCTHIVVPIVRAHYDDVFGGRIFRGIK